MSEKPRKRSAYELTPQPITLDAAGRAAALHWWQTGSPYLPLNCPVCGVRLLAESGFLVCPTRWCRYQSCDIPWGVYVAYQQFLAGLDDS